MLDIEMLYRIVGKKIRSGRERAAGRYSQEKLAKRLGISRASIVNIEAGRQHAPLHILWHIAEALDMDLLALIPRRTELLLTTPTIELSDAMRQQIEQEAKGNPELQKSLTGIVGKLLTTIETTLSTKAS